MKASYKQDRNWMTAITFAEAGEWASAREMTPVPRQQETCGGLQNMLMAAAFAEAGLHDDALRFITPRQQKRQQMGNFLETVRLGGVHLQYGVLRIAAV